MDKSIIYSIDELRILLQPVFKQYDVKRAVLFGSYSKGKATEKSDIDLLVDSGLKGLKFIGLVEAIRRSLDDKEVDVFDVTHVDSDSMVKKKSEAPELRYMRNDVIVVKMIDIIEKIQNYTIGYDYDRFSDNEMLVEASVFNLSQIGELANKIDEEYEESHRDIPWRQIYGLRNRIIHDYEGINLKLIWEIIHDDLSDLKRFDIRTVDGQHGIE